jgi:hypothetical protein
MIDNAQGWQRLEAKTGRLKPGCFSSRNPTAHAFNRAAQTPGGAFGTGAVCVEIPPGVTPQPSLSRECPRWAALAWYPQLLKIDQMVDHAQAKAASAEADRSLRVRRLPAGEHRDEALNPLGARLWACGLVDAQ